MIAKLFVLFWAVLLTALMSVMMISHLVPLPAFTQRNAVLDLQSASLASVTVPASATKVEAAQGWRMIHVLVAGCPCSAFTAQALMARGPSIACHETVFVVGGRPDWKDSLAQAGFDVQEKDGEQLLKDTGIAGGPWLLLLSPAGKIVYSGGYASGRPRPGIILQDMNILQSALKSEALPDYPAYGCAATALLKGKLDPVGVCQSIE